MIEKILFILSQIGKTHLNRLLLVGLHLKCNPTEIAFAFSQKPHNQTSTLSFRSFHIADTNIVNFIDNIYDAYTPNLIEQCIKDELEVIKVSEAKAVIGDLRLTAAISSKLAGIPYISVVNACMTDYFNPVDVMISKSDRLRDHQIASAASKLIQKAQKRNLAKNFRKVAHKYKLKHLNSLYDFLTGDLTLIADLPEFCPLEDLPSNFKYIGPLIWEGIDADIPDFLDNLDNSKTLIYVTIGNTGDKHLIQLVIDTFGQDPNYEVVVTTGAFVHPEEIPHSPNIHIAQFIPGSEVLKRVHAVIHCGGSGTTYQAMAQGVPAVVVPFNNEQSINAWLIKRHQVGIPLSFANLTGIKLKQTIEVAIKDPKIRESLQYFQNLLHQTDGPGNAATEIMSFLSN